MVLKRVLAATAAAALAIAPTAATAQNAAPAPAIESVEGSELRGENSALIGLGIFILLVVAIYFIAEENDEEQVVSP